MTVALIAIGVGGALVVLAIIVLTFRRDVKRAEDTAAAASKTELKEERAEQKAEQAARSEHRAVADDFRAKRANRDIAAEIREAMARDKKG